MIEFHQSYDTNVEVSVSQILVEPNLGVVLVRPVSNLGAVSAKKSVRRIKRFGEDTGRLSTHFELLLPHLPSPTMLKDTQSSPPREYEAFIPGARRFRNITKSCPKSVRLPFCRLCCCNIQGVRRRSIISDSTYLMRECLFRRIWHGTLIRRSSNAPLAFRVF